MNTRTLVGLVAILVLSLCLPAAARADSWVKGCVACAAYFEERTDRSLRLDAAGQPRMVYGGDYLYYAWRDAGGWHVETADPTAGVGSEASLALDGADRPHVAYCDATNTALRYAVRDGGQWHVETVDDGSEWYDYTSIAVDPAGNPHITYRAFASNVVDEQTRYAYRDAAGWHIEAISQGLSSDTSLALTADGSPRVLFAWEGSVVYGYRDAEGWHTEEVHHRQAADTERAVLGGWEWLSLALGSMDRPHAVFMTEQTGNTIEYAYRDSSGWHYSTVATVDGMAGWLSIAIGPGDRPHISFHYDDLYELKYAYRDASGWHTGYVDDQGGLSQSTSIAVDASGRPHITYVYNNALRYAVKTAAGWQFETVDTAADYSSGTGLALGADGQLRALYYSAFDWTWMVATREGASWIAEPVNGGADYQRSGEAALAVDGAGQPHVAYASGTQYAPAGLAYAYRDGAGWHQEIVDPAFDGAPYELAALALGPDGTPHLSYSADDNLVYAYRDGAGWHKQTLDSGPSCQYTDLAVDDSGYPHVVYRCSYLFYAYQDAAGWHTETVDSYTEWPSLALDGTGAPHLAYFSNLNGLLRYAYRDGEGWHVEDAIPGKNLYPSLLVDMEGQPSVAYYAEEAGQLRYGYRDEAGWHVRTVDNQGDTGLHPSLVQDAMGRLHVVYLNATTRDVRYAWLFHSDYQGYLPLVAR